MIGAGFFGQIPFIGFQDMPKEPKEEKSEQARTSGTNRFAVRPQVDGERGGKLRLRRDNSHGLHCCGRRHFCVGTAAPADGAGHATVQQRPSHSSTTKSLKK